MRTIVLKNSFPKINTCLSRCLSDRIRRLKGVMKKAINWGMPLSGSNQASKVYTLPRPKPRMKGAAKSLKDTGPRKGNGRSFNTSAVAGDEYLTERHTRKLQKAGCRSQPRDGGNSTDWNLPKFSRKD